MKIKFFFIFFIFIFTKVESQQTIIVSASNPLVKKIDNFLELPASVIANESVNITSVVSEKIKSIFFQEGKFVKRINYLSNSLIQKIQNKLQISAELEEAELNYQRAEKLISKGNISQSILDNRIMVKKN